MQSANFKFAVHRQSTDKKSRKIGGTYIGEFENSSMEFTGEMNNARVNRCN